MEMRFSVYHRKSIFCNLAVQHFRGIIVLHNCRRLLAYCNALSAAYALIVINDSLSVHDLHSIVTAVFLTDFATDTIGLVNHRLRRRMKLKLAAYARRTHTEILERSAESALLMTLEMVH